MRAYRAVGPVFCLRYIYNIRHSVPFGISFAVLCNIYPGQ